MRPQIVQRVDRNDAVQGRGGFCVDALDSGMCHRGPDKGGVQHAVEMNVVEVARFAAQQGRVFDPIYLLTEHRRNPLFRGRITSRERVVIR